MTLNNFLDQIKKINEKVDIDNEFPDWNKTVQFKIKNDDAFYFTVHNGMVSQVAAGTTANPDVTIEGELKDMEDLFEGRLAIVGGFICKNLKITGAVGDAIGANVLIQAARIF